MVACPLKSTLFPYTTLFRSVAMPFTAAMTGLGQRTTESIISEQAASVLAKKPRPRSGSLRCAVISLRSCRSEEHTSELQSHSDLVCRLLLEKENAALRTSRA